MEETVFVCLLFKKPLISFHEEVVREFVVLVMADDACSVS